MSDSGGPLYYCAGCGTNPVPARGFTCAACWSAALAQMFDTRGSDQ